MRWWLALLLLVVPLFSHADEQMQLKVRPMLCIVDERTPFCRMSFLVFWQSAETGYYCLFNDFAESPLRCWAEQRAGEHNDERTVDAGFRYWMAGDGDGPPLAFAVVEVLRMDSDDRRRRRRSRYVWDIY